MVTYASGLAPKNIFGAVNGFDERILQIGGVIHE